MVINDTKKTTKTMKTMKATDYKDGKLGIELDDITASVVDD